MKVFKFGGASVKDADAVKNVADIMHEYKDEQILVIVSAMGKTTNALEKVVDAYCKKNADAEVLLEDVKTYHAEILDRLFPDTNHPVYQKVNNFFVEIHWVLEEEPRDYNFVYDQIVSTGELISSAIVSAWLNESECKNSWLDIRDCLNSDNTYREGKINWAESEKLVKQNISKLFSDKNKVVLTQGFIASTTENYSITLGREGSDYSASILAYILNAESVTIWKDVPGVLNADPKFFNDAQKLEQLSYHDAIELAYYGASVIHPKTIKPLENKGIPLYVKSFLNHHAKGTVIGKDLQTKPLVPTFIFKSNQVLISIAAKDFSFIAEENISNIFATFADLGLKVNLMQNSAISFSVCFDDDDQKIPKLITKLQENYRIRYNTNLQLYTIRHYYPSTIETLSQGREILLEQRSRNTAQLIMKAEE